MPYSVLVIVVYSLNLIVNVVANIAELALLSAVTKPVIMLLLIALLLIERAAFTAQNLWLMLAAYAFALAGDLLLIGDSSPVLFLLGMSAFFVMHVLYTVVFVRLPSITPLAVLLFIPYSAVGLACVIYLRGFVEPSWLSGIIGIYVAAVVVMSTSASKLGALGLLGALLFGMSDLALAAFHFAEPRWFPDSNYVHAFVIATYGFAQLLLAVGLLRREFRIAQDKINWVRLDELE